MRKRDDTNKQPEQPVEQASPNAAPSLGDASAPMTHGDASQLIEQLMLMNHRLGLLVVATDRQSRVINAMMTQKAADSVDSAVELRIAPDGTQVIRVRDTREAAKAVAAKVEAATVSKHDEWGTY